MALTDPELIQQIDRYRALLADDQRDTAAAAYRSFAKTLYTALGAYSLMVDLLLPLFPDGIDHPPALTHLSDQSAIATSLGNALSGLGRDEEALYVRILTLRLNYEARDATSCGVSLRNIATTLSYLDQRPAAATRILRLALMLAEKTGDHEKAALTRLFLFRNAVWAGMDAEAETLYADFIAAPPRERRALWLANAELRRVHWLIGRGQEAGAALAGLAIVAHAGQNSAAIRELPLYRGEEALARGDAAAARNHFSEGLTVTREAGLPNLIRWAHGGLARAEAQAGALGAARQRVTAEAVGALAAAEVYSLLYQAEGEAGDRTSALEQARRAHQRACGDGEPWVDRWHLKRASAVFTALGETPPLVPVYDEAADELLPYETEMRRWVESMVRFPA